MTSPESVESKDKLIPSLAQFQGEHDRMMALFTTYQCALMALDLQEARAGLEGLQYELLVHMQVEDTVLMPLFLALDVHLEGGSPEFFEKEHSKLKRLLDGLFLHLVGLEELQAAGDLDRRHALAVIESGFTFKHLFEHHTSREDKAFYPPISASLTSAERESTWRRMDVVEAGARSDLGRPPSMGDLRDPS